MKEIEVYHAAGLAAALPSGPVDLVVFNVRLPAALHPFVDPLSDQTAIPFGSQANWTAPDVTLFREGKIVQRVERDMKVLKPNPNYDASTPAGSVKFVPCTTMQEARQSVGARWQQHKNEIEAPLLAAKKAVEVPTLVIARDESGVWA